MSDCNTCKIKTCILDYGTVGCDNVKETYKQGKTDVLDEALQIIHNIYTQDLYCMSEMCDRDNQGYDCEDCLYKSIKQNLEQLKEQ